MRQYQRTRILSKKEGEKKLKYKLFCIEIHKMRKMTLMIITIITGHHNNNKKFKVKLGSHARKTFSIFGTKDSCTWNVRLNTESAAV